MILGLGTDMTEVARVSDSIERNGRRFLDRIFTVEEQFQARKARCETVHFASMFSVKEAVAKALGTGITSRVRWTDLTVQLTNLGTCKVVLEAGALRRACRLATKGFRPQVAASVAVVSGYAFATAVIERVSAKINVA